MFEQRGRLVEISREHPDVPARWLLVVVRQLRDVEHAIVLRGEHVVGTAIVVLEQRHVAGHLAADKIAP